MTEHVQLTPKFSLEEMIKTDTGLYNKPSVEQAHKLLYLATFILQPTRDVMGAIKVNSGFRSTAVNEAVNGSVTSQHCLGEAADIVPLNPKINVYSLFDYMESHFKGQYGQIIREDHNGSQWVHISLPRMGKESQSLVYEDGEYTQFKRT